MGKISIVTEIPGPNSRALVARREAAIAQGAAKLTPLAIVSAHGATMTDADGNTFLDFAGGIGMLAVGHTPDDVVEALREQAGELLHMCTIVATHDAPVALAERLNACAPGPEPPPMRLKNQNQNAPRINSGSTQTSRGPVQPDSRLAS
mgnify:CR=1 FL=1